jgi:hypothetical protein
MEQSGGGNGQSSAAVVEASAGGGTLTVSWRAPTRNTDGSPLTDLTGYTIYYGTRPGHYTAEISIADPLATRAVVHGLQPRVYYYFAVTANNGAGRHSVLSNETRGKARRE